MFNEFLDDITEDVLPGTPTMLQYKIHADNDKGADNKENAHKGNEKFCDLADSFDAANQSKHADHAQHDAHHQRHGQRQEQKEPRLKRAAGLAAVHTLPPILL